jgi:O-antigen ligase
MIHRNIFYFCLLGISFFLPVYGRIVPPIIILVFLNWLIEAPFRKNFKLVFIEKERFLLFSFSFLYFLYLIGMTYSTNLIYGKEDLEIKLSLLVFPLIFSTLDDETLTKKQRFKVVVFFVLGCIIGTLILLGHSLYDRVINHWDYSFYYSGLSWYFHPTYIAMYLSFSIAIIAWYIIAGEVRIRPLWKIMLILLSIYFLILIILLSSKAGILSFALVMIFFSGVLVLKKKNWLTGLIFLITSFLILYLGMQFFPYATGRISNATKSLSEESTIRSDNSESTASRIMVWKAGLEILCQHPFFGTGTGDVKDELLAKYQEKNIKPAFDKRLNAHNQYMQTFISIGVFGFLFLAGMLFLPIYFAIRHEQYLYVVFLLIFAVNIAFESMLEVQAGVVFYTFFNAVFFWKRKETLAGSQ